MKHPKIRLEQPFVVMVGIAALIHSTWSISTFSGGQAPAVTGDPLSALAWVWWVIPGFLAAFALEVGQVETARQIRHGQGRRLRLWKLSLNMKVITFVVLSAGTYLFQLVYLLHHFPDLPLSAGLSGASQTAAKLVMEIVTWLSPLLLPLTMWMGVASDTLDQEATQNQTTNVVAPRVAAHEYLDHLAEVRMEDQGKSFLTMPRLVNLEPKNGNHE